MVLIIVIGVYSKGRKNRRLPLIPQSLTNCCSGRITEPSPPSFDLQQPPRQTQSSSGPDQFDTTYTQPCTSFSQFPETSFNSSFCQAPPPSYEREDRFATKFESPKEDDLDLPPPYEPPTGQLPPVFSARPSF